MHTIVAAARANDLRCLDGPYAGYTDAAGLARACQIAVAMGFDGKTLIHPNQIAPCNAVFSPSPDEVAQARKTIAAFDLPENRDKGVVQIDGRMVERMHAELVKAVNAPDVRQKFAEQIDMEILGSTPAEFAAFQKAEVAKWAAVIKSANIKLE